MAIFDERTPDLEASVTREPMPKANGRGGEGAAGRQQLDHERRKSVHGDVHGVSATFVFVYRRHRLSGRTNALERHAIPGSSPRTQRRGGCRG